MHAIRSTTVDDDNRWACSIYSLLTVLLVVLKLAGLTNLEWWVCTSPAWGGITVYIVLQLIRFATKRNASPTPSEHNL